VDLVLLDVVMPAGGLPCYHKLKAERPDVRVLVCTGFGPEGEASAILAAGADGLLAKPFEIAELKRSAEAALARA
jgi:DNA-binding response OmpR family regulator